MKKIVCDVCEQVAIPRVSKTMALVEEICGPLDLCDKHYDAIVKAINETVSHWLSSGGAYKQQAQKPKNVSLLPRDNTERGYDTRAMLTEFFRFLGEKKRTRDEVIAHMTGLFPNYSKNSYMTMLSEFCHPDRADGRPRRYVDGWVRGSYLKKEGTYNATFWLVSPIEEVQP